MADLALTGNCFRCFLGEILNCALCKEPLGQDGSTSRGAYNATSSAQDSVCVLILTHDKR